MMNSHNFPLIRVDNPTLMGQYKQLVSSESSGTYYGWARLHVTTNEPAWYIMREVVNGGNAIREWALGGTEKAIWDSRASYFSSSINYGNQWSTDFNGQNQWCATTATSWTFLLSQPLSLSVWVRHATFLTTNPMVYAGTLNVVNQNGYGLSRVLGTQQIDFRIGASGANGLQMRTPAVLTTNTWYHVVATYNGTPTPAGVQIYVNGVPQTLTVVQNTATLNPSANFFSVGRASAGSAYMLGQLDEVALFNYELSSSDVSELYNAGNVGNPNNLTIPPIAWYRMGDQATFPVINNVNGANPLICNNMTASNFVTEVPP